MTAPVPISCLYFGKLTVIFFVALITQGWVGILYLIAGKLAGLPGLCPAEVLFWLLRGTLAAIAVGALQLLFSIPIGIALAGGVIGMLISNEGFGIYWPYSLVLMGMNSNKSADVLSGNSLLFVLSAVLYFLMFYLIAVRILKTRDIRTM